MSVDLLVPAVPTMRPTVSTVVNSDIILIDVFKMYFMSTVILGNRENRIPWTIPIVVNGLTGGMHFLRMW